ncbi:hypothetical protein [Anaerococcus nagyae]|uniref:hypothetical protein n=1 Tax=Anaerococcus nagyae TaxID=1755241 RepID=UPI003735D34E
MQRDELKGIIIASGKTQADVAKHLNMAPKTFSLKLNSGEFGSSDIDKMIDYLDIKDPMWIFFDRKVTFKDTKVPYYTKLG